MPRNIEELQYEKKLQVWKAASTYNKPQIKKEMAPFDGGTRTGRSLVVVERIADGQYLAVFVYQLAEAERGGMLGWVCIYRYLFLFTLCFTLYYLLWCTRGGSFSQLKLGGLTPGTYFIMLCGISCELAGCVHRPIMDSESTIAGWGQTKPSQLYLSWLSLDKPA